MGQPRIAIPVAPGTNRHEDTASACRMAGASFSFITIYNIDYLDDFHAMIIPGGFSYGDAIYAGKRLATVLEKTVIKFIETGRPIIGICNGFQALAAMGLFGQVSLIKNQQKKFECRWVTMTPQQCKSPIVQKLKTPINCPIAHAEGRFFGDVDESQIAFRYTVNPNGSINDIAGVCDSTGLVLGFMPHPENAIYDWQGSSSGLYVFDALVNFLMEKND